MLQEDSVETTGIDRLYELRS